MEDLQEYENEYYGHVQVAQEKLALAEASCASFEAGRAACGAAERAAEAAKDVVQMMELEGQALTATARGNLQEHLRSCRDEVASLKARIHTVRAAARSNTLQPAAKKDRIREECFAGRDRFRDEGECSRMISNNSRISMGTERLNAAHSVTLDMENTAYAILVRPSAPNALAPHAGTRLRAGTALSAMLPLTCLVQGDLSKQRETLNHARATLKFSSDGLDRSRRLLNTMARRASMNKFTMCVQRELRPCREV